jgi:hypothetical protein
VRSGGAEDEGCTWGISPSVESLENKTNFNIGTSTGQKLSG